RSKTYYALTNQRVIIIFDFIIWNVKSLDIGSLPELTLGKLESDGQGTITFGSANYFAGLYESLFLQPNKQSAPQFEMIPDARGVYDQIRAARNDVTFKRSQG